MNAPKVRCASQCTKDVTYVISRLDAVLVHALPIVEYNIVDYFDACIVDVYNGKRKATAHIIVEVLDHRFTRVLTIELFQCSLVLV